MSTTPANASVLSQYQLPPQRCSNCHEELPGRSICEFYPGDYAYWICVRCPECGRWTPVRLEQGL